MKKEEITKKILQIVEFNLSDSVEPDEKIFADMDSLDKLSIVMQIEKEFNITISDQTLIDMSIEDLSVNELSEKLITEYKL